MEVMLEATVVLSLKMSYISYYNNSCSNLNFKRINKTLSEGLQCPKYMKSIHGNTFCGLLLHSLPKARPTLVLNIKNKTNKKNIFKPQ